MYKLYMRLHLDYSDIIYHKSDPELTLEFTKKLETVQYSAALAVSRLISVTLQRTGMGIPLSQKMV